MSSAGEALLVSPVTEPLAEKPNAAEPLMLLS